MQPNQQNNYWRQDSETEEITEMYQPEPVEDDAVDNPYVRPGHVKSDDDPVHWSASEYIHEEKNGLWFVGLAVVALLFIAIDIFLLKSYTFSVLIVVMAIAIIIYSHRPPRAIDYTLSGNQGLYIGETLHHFSEFKSFGLIKDGQHFSIMLMPTKRFSPGVSVYFPEEVGEQIIDILGARLPMETLKLDLVDIVVRKLRL